MMNAIRKSRGLLVLAAALAAPAAAYAHPGHAGPEASGFTAGLLHPLTGADHLLAMIAVGLWAAMRGGRATWAWPTAFVAALLAGFGLAQMDGGGAAMVEPAVLASVIALGALTAADARVPTALGVGLMALFGAAHGYAHGAEAGGAGFALGMVASTATLHLTGLGGGLMLARDRRAVRLLGAGAVLGGLLLGVAG